MICDKCKKPGELKRFDTFQFYFCGECKEEIKLEEGTSETKKFTKSGIRSGNSEWLKSNPMTEEEIKVIDGKLTYDGDDIDEEELEDLQLEFDRILNSNIDTVEYFWFEKGR